VNSIMGLFRTFWGGLIGLIALMLILERAGGLSTILGATTRFATGVVGAFK